LKKKSGKVWSLSSLTKGEYSMRSDFLNRFKALAAVALFALALGLVQGCAKKVQEEGPGDSSIPTAADADENRGGGGDSDSGQAMGLQTVHFAYDSFALDADGKNTLKANAGIMKDKKSLHVQIEGHCDARGGIQYNLALGEKRANIVRKYMTELGVPKDRLTTISFGKERLIDPGNSEDAHAKNRRANFAITQ
jgi:peptidoglycan-associated lipoprotein